MMIQFLFSNKRTNPNERLNTPVKISFLMRVGLSNANRCSFHVRICIPKGFPKASRPMKGAAV